jgi:HK97 family phage portal protein
MSFSQKIKSFFNTSIKHRPFYASSLTMRDIAYGGSPRMQASEHYAHNVIVYRCIQLISRGVGSIPWLLYKGKNEIENHPLLSLLSVPNIKQADATFREELVSHLLMFGNVYLLKTGQSHNYPLELNLLRPEHIKILKSDTFMPKAYEYSISGKKYSFPIDPLTGKSDVLHIKFFNPLDFLYGMSPLVAAASAIDQHNAVGEHNLSLLKNGGRPSGAFIIKPDPHDIGLTEEQRMALSSDIKSIYEGTSNAGRVLFLEGDFEWKEMGTNLKDLDFLSGKNLSAREIAQAFGVPPMLVGVPGDATFSNYREARYHLWEDTILPLMDLIVGEFNRWISHDFNDDLTIAYDADAIPALALKREASWEKIAHVDFLTIDEKRQAVGYGKLPKNMVV